MPSQICLHTRSDLVWVKCAILGGYIGCSIKGEALSLGIIYYIIEAIVMNIKKPSTLRAQTYPKKTYTITFLALRIGAQWRPVSRVG